MRASVEACRLGTFRKTHRVSDEQRHIRGHLSVREALVRTRAKFITLAKSLLCGQRCVSCAVEMLALGA
ncbi:MAG: hypothetical protein A2289_03805 [Deltaproteobacteria bacterium RIFOXYA12_FULL_58_15]|nr:MAG: hypothetical protein A2289_03805 [Deltaproteobacteria bacterium RIFOXYA12_FULL_58_15]